MLEVRKDHDMTLDNCYYICAVCSKKMTAHTLVAHIKSVPHRLKFSVSVTVQFLHHTFLYSEDKCLCPFDFNSILFLIELPVEMAEMFLPAL